MIPYYLILGLSEALQLILCIKRMKLASTVVRNIYEQ